MSSNKILELSDEFFSRVVDVLEEQGVEVTEEVEVLVEDVIDDALQRIVDEVESFQEQQN